MIEVLRQEILECECCSYLVDDAGRRRKFTVFGSAGSKWMIVGEAPGKRSIDHGRPWSSAPYLVRRAVERTIHPREQRNLVLEQDFYITDVVKCLPPGNRTPQREEILNCEAFLLREIDLIMPEALITFGQTASRFVMKFFDSEPEIRGQSVITSLHKTYVEPIRIRRGSVEMLWRPFMHPRWSFKFLGSAMQFESSVANGIRLAIERQGY